MKKQTMSETLSNRSAHSSSSHSFTASLLMRRTLSRHNLDECCVLPYSLPLPLFRMSMESVSASDNSSSTCACGDFALTSSLIRLFVVDRSTKVLSAVLSTPSCDTTHFAFARLSFGSRVDMLPVKQWNSPFLNLTTTLGLS